MASNDGLEHSQLLELVAFLVRVITMQTSNNRTNGYCRAGVESFGIGFALLIRYNYEMSSSASNHSVRFFDSFDSRTIAVADFVQEGLANGMTVLSVATRPTWTAVESLLRRRGVAVDDVAAAEQMLVLDAHKQLERFMLKDWPDPALLDMTLGTIVRDLAGRPRPLRIYGEMVDVLAERGLHRAAQRLEELWNTLAASASFELFCGYTSGHFGDERTNAALKAICAEHSHVECREEDVLAKFLLVRTANLAP